MDLISTLIAVKKSNTDIESLLTSLLDECIKYEKLSKAPKFQHIRDNPFLQKQLPNLWKAFQGDAETVFLLTNTMSIVQEFLNAPSQLFLDFSSAFTSKEKRRLLLLGESKQYHFSFHHLSELTESDYQKAFYILSNDHQTYFSVLIMDDKIIHVYSGLYDNVASTSVLQPYITVNHQKVLKIYYYSVQGNNDFPFAKLQSDQTYMISLDDNTLVYTSDISISKELSESDVKNLRLNNSLETISDLIFRYAPSTTHHLHFA